MNYLHIIKSKWQTLVLITMGFVVLSLVLTLIQPFEYRSRVELLIVQKQTYNMDAYAATRAAEKMATNLAAVVKTKSFFDKVLAGNFGISRSDFPTDENDLRKAWQKKITTQVFPETSILSVNIYDKNKREANRIASAVAYVLVNDSAEYIGAGSEVSIKVVNEPLVSNSPVRPNIVLNLLGGLVIGLVLSLGWIFYRSLQNVESLNSEIKNFDPEFVAGDSEEMHKAHFDSSDLSLRDSDEARREKIRNIFEPQIKTMHDDLSNFENNLIN